jgi:putative sigma-54 modulation protein
MQFQFSFKHMATSPALQTYAEEKLGDKISKFVTKPIGAHVTFSVTRHQHTAHLSLDAGDGFKIQVEHTSEDMYASVDELAEKLASQLRKQKEKLKEHKGVRLAQNLERVSGRTAAPEGAATEVEVIDAGDIPKYENGKKRATGH